MEFRPEMPDRCRVAIAVLSRVLRPSRLSQGHIPRFRVRFRTTREQCLLGLGHPDGTMQCLDDPNVQSSMGTLTLAPTVPVTTMLRTRDDDGHQPYPSVAPPVTLGPTHAPGGGGGAYGGGGFPPDGDGPSGNGFGGGGPPPPKPGPARWRWPRWWWWWWWPARWRS